jgi:hypothetical protein
VGAVVLHLKKAFDEESKYATLHRNRDKPAFFSKRLIAIAILIFIMTMSQTINSINTQQTSSEGLSLLWVRTGHDYGRAYATCVIGSTVYVIGESGEGVVEARDINTGELLYMYREPFYGSNTELFDCVVLDGYLYVVGNDYAPGDYEWLILKFTPDLRLVAKTQYNPSESNDYAHAIATDGKYLYIGGVARKTWEDSEWLLLKVDPSDLSVINTYKTNPTTGWDAVGSIGVNPIDNKIWLVGMVNFPASDGPLGRVEVLSQDLTLITSKDLEYFCIHMTFDELGYAYTLCGSEILKMSSNLDIVTRKGISPGKILYSNGHLYLAGEKNIGGYWRHVVMRLSKDLDVLDELVLSMQINANSHFYSRGKMALVNNKLLVAGTSDDRIMVIYAISIGSATTDVGTLTSVLPTPTSVTITNPITIPITQIVTKTVTQAIASITTETLTKPTTITQLITTTVTVAQPPTTYTTTITKTVVSERTTVTVTTTIPESTLTITAKPLFSEDFIALAIAVAMVVTSIAIGLKLRKK